MFVLEKDKHGSKTNGAVNLLWNGNVLKVIITKEIMSVWKSTMIVIKLKAAKCASIDVEETMKVLKIPRGNITGACNVLKVTGSGKENVLTKCLNQKDGSNGAMMRAGDVISVEKITFGENMTIVLLVRLLMDLTDGGNQRMSVFGAEIIKIP